MPTPLLSVFRDSVLDQARAPRLPLRAWAARLANELARIDCESPNGRTALGTIQNNASLIEVWRGNLQGAQKLCERQMWWAAQQMREHGPRACGALAIQPWINLGRLLRLRGDPAGALPHFSLFRHAANEENVMLGPVRIDGSTFRAIVEEAEMAALLRTIYLVDSTKTLLAASELAEAERLLDRAGPFFVEGRSYPLPEEMKMLVQVRKGRPDDAMVLADAPAWEWDAYTALVGVTYRVALRAAIVSEADARARASMVAGRVLAAAGLARPPDTRVLRYLHALGLLVLSLGLADEASALFRLGVTASRHLGDVPSEISFLDAWLPLAGVNAARGALERETLVRESLYGARATGLAVDVPAQSESVFSELHAKLDAAVYGARAVSRAS